MAKEIKQIVKLQIKAGKANPAPPVGTALGPTGINIQDFCSAFNEKTRELGDTVIPVVLTIYEDRSFTFITKKPPMAVLIMKKLGLKKGSGEPNKNKVATMTWQQAKEVAEEKMEDLNANDIEAAAHIVAGTARSMGVDITDKPAA